jgi:hypothetical protein
MRKGEIGGKCSTNRDNWKGIHILVGEPEGMKDDTKVELEGKKEVRDCGVD